MTVDERVREVLGKEKHREENSNFKSLRDFYEAMKKEGLVVQQQYTLPPVDTIGRNIDQTSHKSNDEPRTD